MRSKRATAVLPRYVNPSFTRFLFFFSYISMVTYNLYLKNTHGRTVNLNCSKMVGHFSFDNSTNQVWPITTKGHFFWDKASITKCQWTISFSHWILHFSDVQYTYTFWIQNIILRLTDRALILET